MRPIVTGWLTSVDRRPAIEVDDPASTGERLVAAGAELVGGPVETPWGDVNVRVRAPDGMQLTLFRTP